MKLSDFDFRIYDNHNKKYIDNIPYSIKKYQNENEVFLPFSTDLREYGFNETFKNEIQIPSDRVEVELWTGLYDKNGKKIYDGDIIKYNKYKLKVEFINSEFIVKGYGNGGFFCLLSNMFNENGYSHIEVIGNIHENPKLLEY
ncbi:hypothetical protein IY972_01860 [Campylobacter volucris]|uniref:YopX family protein n=1 Tax=Campylobacter volucris TaxID=1031542 RepID=UPI00189F1264|nr:YopX family protein [Campylobacter volucris]MBF7059658.1 hypothetical protein [Campylobacter volucris]